MISDDGDRSDINGGRDGEPIHIVHSKGQRGKQYRRNSNESAVATLFEKGLIGMPEREAAQRYHGLVMRSAVGSLGAPSMDRVPGGNDGDAKRLDALCELRKINSQLPRAYRSVLMFAFHPQTHGTLRDLDEHMGYQPRMMHGRLMLIEALKEVAELWGYSQNTGGKA